MACYLFAPFQQSQTCSKRQCNMLETKGALSAHRHSIFCFKTQGHSNPSPSLEVVPSATAENGRLDDLLEAINKVDQLNQNELYCIPCFSTV